MILFITKLHSNTIIFNFVRLYVFIYEKQLISFSEIQMNLKSHAVALKPQTNCLALLNLSKKINRIGFFLSGSIRFNYFSIISKFQRKFLVDTLMDILYADINVIFLLYFQKCIHNALLIFFPSFR